MALVIAVLTCERCDAICKIDDEDALREFFENGQICPDCLGKIR